VNTLTDQREFQEKAENPGGNSLDHIIGGGWGR